MKKDYVSLNVQVVDVQLSDCIAGSGNTTFSVNQGLSVTNDGSSSTTTFTFDTW